MKKAISILLAVTMLFTMSFTGIVSAEETVDYSAYYKQIIDRWEEILIGSGELDTSDPVIAEKVETITSNAKTYWEAMTRPEGENPTKEDYFDLWLNNSEVFSTYGGHSLRGYIWEDEACNPSNSSWGGVADTYSSRQFSPIRANFDRISAMAMAYRVGDETLKGNPEFLKEIVYALDFLTTYWYAETTNQYGDWYAWNVNIPLAINDIAVLLRNDVDIEFLKKCVYSINYFEPHPSNMTGSNLVYLCNIKVIMGAFLEDSSYLETAKSGFEKVLTYVTSGDGFYESDGSFIQHYYFAYVGGYGAGLYDRMSVSLVALKDTPWDISDEKKAMLFGTIQKAVEPIITDNGQLMEIVLGRGVASSNGSVNAFNKSRDIVNCIAIFAQMAEGEQAEYLKSLAKKVLTQLTSDEVMSLYNFNYYSGTDLGVYLYAKAILEDDTIAPFERTIINQVFYNQDKVAQHNGNYSLGLSMHSTRTGSYEENSGGNRRGWYQGCGMLYVYNDDYKKYSDHFWYTVDSWHLPGTTSLYGVEMTNEDLSGKGCGQNPWAGGTELGDYTIASMLLHPADVTLNAKKSYFMFDNEVVALGAGITSSDNALVETTVENIKLLDDNSNKFIIDGVETTIDANGDGEIDTADNSIGTPSTQNTVTKTISKYAHLSGNTEASAMGYYFPEETTLNIGREARTGYFKLIYLNTASASATTERTKNYLKMYYSHGKNAEDSDKYSYVLLPGATAEETAAYSENADVEILSNTEDIQAVYDKKLNMTGVTFWNDGENTVMKDGEEWITSNGACSLMVSESEDEITVAVSDPTQLKTDKFCVEINAATNGVSVANEDITVLQHGEKTIIEIDPTSVKGSKGETKTITLTKGEYVSEEEPVAPTVTGETIGTKEGTAVSKYLTISGTRPIELTTDCTVDGIEIDRFGTLTVADTVPVGKYTFNVTATNAVGSTTAEFTVLVLSNIAVKTPSNSVLYYTFNEGYGNLVDAIVTSKEFTGSTQNFDATLTDTVEWVDGFVGTALKFDSPDDTLSLKKVSGYNNNTIGMHPNQSVFGGATEYDFWVKFNTNPAEREQIIFAKYHKSNTPWAVKVTKEGKIAFCWNGVWYESDTMDWNTDEWYHINIKHTSAYALTIKRDGNVVGTGTTGKGIGYESVMNINKSAPFDSTNYFDGVIDELYLGAAGGGEEIRLRSKVSFNTDGGTEIAPQYVDLGGTATKPENPTKDGYIFIGWFDKDGNAFDFKTAINTDTTVYAGFVDADSEYAASIVTKLTSSDTVKNKVILYYGFNDGYGTTVSRVGRSSLDSCDYSATLSSGVEWVDGFVGSAVKFDSSSDYLKMVSAKNHQGYIGMDPKQSTCGTSKAYDFWIKFNEDLSDWTADQLILGRDYNNGIPWAIKVTKEGKLSFCWSGTWYDSDQAMNWKAGEWYHINITHAYSSSSTTYTITLKRDGISVGSATHTTAWKTSSRVMYINGFNASGTDVFTDKKQYFNGTIDELYLGGSDNVSRLYVRHKVSFDANGGSDVEPAYVWSGETVAEPTAPTMDGYDFAGWYTDAECTTAYDFTSAVKADTTLYAKWTEISYGDANGDGEIATDDLVILRQYLIDALTAEDINIDALDVCYDGVIDLKDLVRFKKYFAGIVDTLGPQNS